MLRFDMRAPGADAAERADGYAAAVEMCEWADTRGAMAAVLSEHHGSPDGFLPSPITLATAIAARTRNLAINVAALLAPLHHPVELAEAMVVLDHLSRGRVSYVLGLGYRPDEYEMYGLAFAERTRLMEDAIARLRAAFDGGVTPAPFTPGGPMLLYGGGSVPAARRAGRLGLGFYCERSDSGLEPVFREAEAAAGHPPGFFSEPPAGMPMVVVIADDVDAAWHAHGPHLLHDAVAYQSWFDAARSPGTAHGSTAATVDELRAEDGRYRIVDPEGARELIERYGVLMMMPLCGGTPPELGWASLRLAADVVNDR
jgi:alkanesulfonate monooxygenase SsuD/methylene tetrahydromethanopterin reductase-like flavin-dependent oxidoreductase (luciferase family)